MHFPDDRNDKMIKPAQKYFICKNKVTFEWGWVCRAVLGETAVRADWGRWNPGPKHTQLLYVHVGEENVPFGCVPGGFVSYFYSGAWVHHRQNSGPRPSEPLLLFLPSWICRITVEALHDSWGRAGHGAVDLCQDALLGFSGMEQLIPDKEPQRLSQNQGTVICNKAFFLSKSTCKTKSWGPCLQTTNISVAKDAKVCLSPASLNWSEKPHSASQERIWALLLNSTTENTGPRHWSEATGCCFAQPWPVLADGFVQQELSQDDRHDLCFIYP